MWSNLALALALAVWQLAGADAAERIVSNDNRRAAGRLTNGVLSIRLEVRAGSLHPEADDGPGIPALAFAEIGRPLQIPGPLIRVPAGTTIRVSVRNPFPDSTLTVHGLHAHPAEGDSGMRIPGGTTGEVRFSATRPGTYYYWGTTTGSAVDDREWFESQLAGAFVVDSAAAQPGDRIFVIGTWFRPDDQPDPSSLRGRNVMVINGRSWPHTERFTYGEGDAVRWRWINPSNDSHPMHLHGFYFAVESRGNWRAERVYAKEERPLVVTNLMLPGETMNMSWTSERPGNWVFHCHFAFHVSEHLVLRRSAAGVPASHTAHSGPAAP
ncbi:MAG: multicopper oxidase domain-containing protein, partial [Gemmatimonadota bacterium]|nr:multicopper oxidase domain-containing protein [Gemmatimonadota bacterium]